jgi:hypothetical protein
MSDEPVRDNFAGYEATISRTVRLAIPVSLPRKSVCRFQNVTEQLPAAADFEPSVTLSKQSRFASENVRTLLAGETTTGITYCRSLGSETASI